MDDQQTNRTGIGPLGGAFLQAFDAASAFAKGIESHPRVAQSKVSACSRVLPDVSSEEISVDVELSNGDALCFCVESMRRDCSWVVETCVGLIRDRKHSTWETIFRAPHVPVASEGEAAAAMEKAWRSFAADWPTIVRIAAGNDTG
jgi:hypothetical protein